MSFRKIFQILSITLSFLISSTSDAENSVPNGIFPVKGISAEQDYTALADLTSNAKIVALGESFHTSEGFHFERDRIIRFLVEKKGFRTIFLESPWAEAQVASEYVKNCKGSADQAVRSLLDVWRSNSFARTLDWLCKYNRNHAEDPVVFAGVDNQNPWADANIIRRSISKTPGISPTVLNGINKCVGVNSTSVESFKASAEWDFYVVKNHPIPLEEHTQCLNSLDFLKNSLIDSDVTLAIISLISWQKRWFLLNRNEQRFINDRDAGMFEIFNKLQSSRSQSRTILIGHNYHIAMSSNPVPNLHPMGTLLKKQYGSEYEAVGLIGYDVEINWPDTQFRNQAPPLEIESAEHKIHKMGVGSALIDVQIIFPQTSPLAIYNNGRLQSVVIRDQFRALVFLEQSLGRTR